MKRVLMMLATTSLLSATSIATAGSTWDPSLDQTYLLNDGNVFNLNFGQTVSFNVDVAPGTPVIGFSFSGIASGIDPTGAELMAEWTHLTVIAPTGESFTVGANGSSSPHDAPWDFSGISWENGLWQHGLGGDQWFGNGLPEFAFDGGVVAEGQWTFSFFQTLSGGIGWEDVNITLHHAVPAPSAITLLAALGFVGRTRRRR